MPEGAANTNHYVYPQVGKSSALPAVSPQILIPFFRSIGEIYDHRSPDTLLSNTLDDMVLE